MHEYGVVKKVSMDCVSIFHHFYHAIFMNGCFRLEFMSQLHRGSASTVKHEPRSQQN